MSHFTALCSDLHHRFATGFFTRCFPSGCAVFKVQTKLACACFVLFRFLSIPENDTGSRRSTVNFVPLTGTYFCLSAVFAHLYAPYKLFTRLRFLSLVSTSVSSFTFLLRLLPRKEVIQPHLPIRLPCYDFTPVIGLTFDGWLLAVTSPASGAPNSHGVTGGVYKARERIHRDMLIRDY